MAAHLLCSRLHLIGGARIFAIDQDEQQEHCEPFVAHLGGRRVVVEDLAAAERVVLEPDDGCVVCDLSASDEADRARSSPRSRGAGCTGSGATRRWVLGRIGSGPSSVVVRPGRAIESRHRVVVYAQKR